MAGASVRVPAAVTCRVLGITRQAYYQWLRDPVSRPAIVSWIETEYHGRV
ncbi:hypothetical protein [Amycolatopsis pigmentata]|uniref:Transposase n=1 Tax=Amycolatopsis pigmentata TaxID=450801 RepID=A0ABW5FZ09_9PSEU